MDVEKRLLLAAATLKRDVADFDGGAFSKRLFATLGISPQDDATDQGQGTGHRKVTGPLPGGHGVQG
jgi:hypothetical protein